MRSWDALPDVPLTPAGSVASQFLVRGVADFREAGRYLQALPYGRTADRADPAAVLREGRGTCSTKHALLDALAREQHLPPMLTLGIYEMHERNTPGVGAVLARHGLDAIPEAHCYLTYRGTRIDVTRSGAEPTEAIARFLHEEAIAPEQIGAYKVAVHRRHLEQWARRDAGAVQGRSLDELWQIREECIAALSQ
jgi:hypothetical protein